MVEINKPTENSPQYYKGEIQQCLGCFDDASDLDDFLRIFEHIYIIAEEALHTGYSWKEHPKDRIF